MRKSSGRFTRANDLLRLVAQEKKLGGGRRETGERNAEEDGVQYRVRASGLRPSQGVEPWKQGGRARAPRSRKGRNRCREEGNSKSALERVQVDKLGIGWSERAPKFLPRKGGNNGFVPSSQRLQKKQEGQGLNARRIAENLEEGRGCEKT